MLKAIKKSILPDKLGKLYKLALNDLEACLKNPVYVYDMGEWHNPVSYLHGFKREGKEKCAICMVGAVLANTFKYKPIQKFKNTDVSQEDWQKLIALDKLRDLEFDMAFVYFYGYTPNLNTKIFLRKLTQKCNWKQKSKMAGAPQKYLKELRFFANAISQKGI